MGTKAHKPTRDKPSADFDARAEEETARTHAGTRPGTRSRIAEARERLKKRGEL